MRAAVVGCALATAACTGPRTVQAYATSRARFDPSERGAVWGRAITSFQETGSLILLSDPLGGVLRSERQPEWLACAHGLRIDGQPSRTCLAQTESQFTLTPDGVAFLRINRAVTGVVSGSAGDASPLADEDVRRLQARCDDQLRFIVGQSSQAPEPPMPPPRGNPDVPSRLNML